MTVLFLFILSGLNAQAYQDEIPDYVLMGKTSNELRLMRNEIFARYGYIFQSEELTNYFSNKRWYRARYTNIDALLTDIDKKNIKLILDFENNANNVDYEIAYTDKSNSSIQKMLDKESGAPLLKITEVSYHQNFEMGFIKKVKEMTDIGAEGVPTVIYAETVDSSKPYWSTTKYFNDLIFYYDYYQAVSYGCCGAETYNEFYSYQSENPFLKSNERFFIVEVPNTSLKFFLAYCHSDNNYNEKIIANLSLSTVEGERSKIIFKAKTQTDFDDILPYFTPDVQLISHQPENIIRGDGIMDLWTKNSVNELNLISDFSIKVIFSGDSSGRKAICEIPIIKALFNGIVGDQVIVIDLK